MAEDEPVIGGQLPVVEALAAPARPVSGTPIASVWGQAVHDAVFLPVGARVVRVTPQSIPNTSETAVIFDAEINDDGGFHAAGNPTRLTIPADGWYLFGCGVAFAPHASGIRQIAIKLNGGAYMAAASQNPPGANDCYMSLVGARYFAAGQYLEVYAFQSSGAPLNVVWLNESGLVFWISPGRGLQ